jgi:DNA mismatch repair ATPase MutS
VKSHLLFPDSDFDLTSPPLVNDAELVQDLELGTLFQAMAGQDDFLMATVKKIVLSPGCQVTTILWRQAILRDCQAHPGVARSLYALTVEAIEMEKHRYLSMFTRYAGAILDRSLEVLTGFLEILLRLRTLAEDQESRFASPGFRSLFSMVRTELNAEYLSQLQDFLEELRFSHGVLMSAGLGEGNKGSNYVLRRIPRREKHWLQRVVQAFQSKPESYAFTLDDRDESGAKALSELRERGINLVANSLGQATDHILSFFQLMRTELAFYVGAMNLADRLNAKGVSTCFPPIVPAGERACCFDGLTDTCLNLIKDERVVGNDLRADGKDLVIITGANQGGKSTFLRAVGLAQLMTQCGLFITAQKGTVELCDGLFTHFRRREDAGMKSGKLDEELGRMETIVDHLKPHSLILFNESFAATNEREGSEIARQIVTALIEKRSRVVFVTHQYEFAHQFFEQKLRSTLFLQARGPVEGHEAFQLTEGEPQPTSRGLDLWDQIFGGE